MVRIICKHCQESIMVPQAFSGRPREACDKCRTGVKVNAPNPDPASKERFAALEKVRTAARHSGAGLEVPEDPAKSTASYLQDSIRKTVMLYLSRCHLLAPRDLASSLRALAEVQEKMYGGAVAKHSYPTIELLFNQPPATDEQREAFANEAMAISPGPKSN